MNRAQRIVVVIGWGLLLATVARFLDMYIGRPGSDDWINYAPSSRTLFTDHFASEGSEGLSLLVWATAVIIWVVGALFLLRTPKGDERT